MAGWACEMEVTVIGWDYSGVAGGNMDDAVLE